MLIIKKEKQNRIKDELKISKQYKSEHKNYIKNFVHDIKAPLANTVAAAECIAMEVHNLNHQEYLPEQKMIKIDSYVKTIKNEVYKANKMISVVSNINSENQVHLSPNNLKHLLNTLITSYQQTNSYGIRTYELYYSIKEEIFFFDKIKMIRIIENLLSNSTKFTDKGMIITEVTKKENIVSICIKDSGSGIVKEDIPHVFKHGFCGTNNRTMPGSGIGLFNVKKFVHLHGGNIDIGSIENKGTAIRLNFPFINPHKEN